MAERMPEMTQPRHANALDFFNALCGDLELELLGHEPMNPIDRERLDEAVQHLRQLEADRVPIIWR